MQGKPQSDTGNWFRHNAKLWFSITSMHHSKSWAYVLRHLLHMQLEASAFSLYKPQLEGRVPI